ncbi:MAG: sulfotransferase, partial [Bdellovibrionales bacterium]|nr:sulfotransferase [Bdellovibrionales bacterium]
LFPDAKFVNIVRDGRAVAHSMLKLYHESNRQLARIDHPLLKEIIPYPRIRNLKTYVDEFGPASIECTAHVWSDTMAFVESVKPRLKSYFEFRYEDLLKSPDLILQDLFKFCELSWPTTPLFKKKVSEIGFLKHANNYTQGEVVQKICREALELYNY